MLDFIKEIIDAENIEFWAPIVVWGAILSKECRKNRK